MRWIILILFAGTCLQAEDNRYRSVVGEPIFVPFVPSTQDVITAIAQSKDEKLKRALGWKSKPAPLTLRLRYNQSVGLQGDSYILCLFDADGTTGASDEARVLVLFSERYEIKTWGEFKGRGFESGTMLCDALSPHKGDSTFVTVNRSSRAPSLWFEKYRVNAKRIEKLGEGSELSKIPDPPQ